MGNQVCCEGVVPEEKIVIELDQGRHRMLTAQPAISHKTSTPEILMLFPISDKAQSSMNKYNTFGEKITKKGSLRKYGDLAYEGDTDQKGRPHGYGRMYYPSGSVYVGEFKEGNASGPAQYFWADGSCYQGQMKNNKANDEHGVYICDKFTYEGGVKDNEFDGEAKQKGDNYEFVGLFKNGKRSKGKLTWTQFQNNEQTGGQNYVYEGQFDQNGNFTGKGQLNGPKGRYKGDFKNGIKDGLGIFEYINKTKYEGTYKNGTKDGKGTIYMKDNKVAYCGEMSNGLPHGKGWIPDQNGNPIHLSWDNGISSVIVSNEEAFKAINAKEE